MKKQRKTTALGHMKELQMKKTQGTTVSSVLYAQKSLK